MAVNDGMRSTKMIDLHVKIATFVDHRVSDESETALFMQALAVFLENPVRMLV